MINPNFQTIAKGFYIPTNKILQREQLKDAISDFIDHDGAVS